MANIIISCHIYNLITFIQFFFFFGWKLIQIKYTIKSIHKCTVYLPTTNIFVHINLSKWYKHKFQFLYK